MQITDFDDELLFDDEILSDGIPDEIIHLPSSEVSHVQAPNFPILKFTEPQETSILWPVYGWRIAAPQIKQRTLDFLQLTSLRLARAGVTRYQEQAKKLGQHKDFLFNVMLQLKDEGYIDVNSRVTEKGEKILQQDGEDEEEETQYGWIFQDATAGELLSWFHTEKLPYLKSKSADINPDMKLPWIRQTPNVPNTADVILAIKTQHRLQKLTADHELSSESNFTEIEHLDTLVNQNFQIKEISKNFGVRFLNKQPQQFYLLVSCMIEGTYDGQFSLCCPFGLPDGFRWVRLLNFATSQSLEGKKIVENLQFRSREVWKKRQPSQLDPESLVKQAHEKVIFEIGLPPERKWQIVWRELEQMQQSNYLLERGFQERDTTIVRSQKVLEQLILTILQLDPIPEDIWQPYKQKDALSQCLKDTIMACGGKEIPERIISTKLGTIRNVIAGGTNSLRPYIAALILSASRRSSLHRTILENIMQNHPDFLVDIEQIAHTRNNFGAHAINNHHEPIISVENVVTKVYQIVISVLKAYQNNS